MYTEDSSQEDMPCMYAEWEYEDAVAAFICSGCSLCHFKRFYSLEEGGYWFGVVEEDI